MLDSGGGPLSIHFLGLGFLTTIQAGISWLPARSSPSLIMRQSLHSLPSDTSMVLTDHQGEGPGSVFLIRRIPGRSISSYVIAQIDLEYLFGLYAEEAEEESIRLSILDEGKILFANLPEDHGESLLKAVPSGDSPRGFSWTAGSGTYLSSSAPVFLKSKFAGTMWLV